jgi:hypothetical protein
MTEPKTQTQRAKAFIESRTGGWLVRIVNDYAAVEVEAATRDLREQLEAAEAVVRLAYECGKGEQAWLAAGEYLKKHGGDAK